MHIQQIVFEDLNKIALRETDAELEPGSGEVVVAPAFHGICGTDLHVLHGKHPWVRPPLVTGHESAGRIVALGSDVQGWALGDQVVVNPLVHCGHCRRCLRGAFNTCENARVIGFRLPGTAQTQFVINASQLHRVPSGLPLDHAVLAEPIAVGVHAASRFDDLDDVLLIGGGTIGQCVLLGLKARGAGRVTIIEPVAAKRELALRLGASDAVAPGTIEATPRFTAAFDVVAAQPTLDLASAAVMGGGCVVVVGVAPGPMSLPMPRMQRFEIDVRGSGMYLGTDIDTAINLLATGEINADRLISATRCLDEVVEAYADAQLPDSVKVLIRME
ncbi:zinc-binding dehydrogenase [Acidisphaera sp. L21]|uniref:zinc-dependent alcohol dehydrogenase n=1 Tax=Acidisphaera sp. L21 TaxID=1641851 RepID=UPI00131C99C0|nr:alcohol dehydrogenase catalytic domain-containing protein [Acidisphaera sp. L21]